MAPPILFRFLFIMCFFIDICMYISTYHCVCPPTTPPRPPSLPLPLFPSPPSSSLLLRSPTLSPAWHESYRSSPKCHVKRINPAPSSSHLYLFYFYWSLLARRTHNLPACRGSFWPPHSRTHIENPQTCSMWPGPDAAEEGKGGETVYREAGGGIVQVVLDLSGRQGRKQ